MHVVIAPDGFGGTLTAREAAEAIAEGWSSVRPRDDLTLVPMSDGGEGLLDVVAGPRDRRHRCEVAGPLGHPVEAEWLLRPDGTAVIESSAACGLHLVSPERRSPLQATTYGVGQLLDVARRAGATRLLVGLGGSATVDGGAGALTALGYRVTVADGSGLRIGGADLHRVAAIAPGWVGDWSGVTVQLLADVTTALADAAERFGPQKGASAEDVRALDAALEVWADVVTRDLTHGRDLRTVPGTGAAGGLGFALTAALRAPLVPGSEVVAELLGLPAAIDGAEVVVTGEGRLDATTGEGKVVAHVVRLAAAAGVRVLAVVGQHAVGGPALDDLEVAAPAGPGPDPAADVAAGAARLARRVGAADGGQVDR